MPPILSCETEHKMKKHSLLKSAETPRTESRKGNKVDFGKILFDKATLSFPDPIDSKQIRLVPVFIFPFLDARARPRFSTGTWEQSAEKNEDWQNL